jgi:TM2 domain-containing membrane protein YozV
MSENPIAPTGSLNNPSRSSMDTQALMLFDANKKSLGVSYVLWLFLGMFGGHRFYNGKTGSALAQLFLNIFGWLTIFAYGLGLLFIIPVAIWVIVDAFLIPGWVQNYNNLLIRRLET